MHFYQQIGGSIYRRSFEDPDYKELVTDAFPVSDADTITSLLNAEYVRGAMDGRYEVKSEIREALGI